MGPIWATPYGVAQIGPIWVPHNSPIKKTRYDINIFIIPALEKGYINVVPKSVHRSSVRPSVTFLVNVSPPKPLDVATSNFVAA